MSLSTRNVLADRADEFGEVHHIKECDVETPNSPGLMSILFGLKRRTAPPHLALNSANQPMSVVTRFEHNEWRFGYDLFSITRDELKGLTPDLVIEDRRPHGHGSPLPDGVPGVMTTAGEYLHEDHFAFVKSLLDIDANIYHFLIG